MRSAWSVGPFDGELVAFLQKASHLDVDRFSVLDFEFAESAGRDDPQSAICNEDANPRRLGRIVAQSLQIEAMVFPTNSIRFDTQNVLAIGRDASILTFHIRPGELITNECSLETSLVRMASAVNGIALSDQVLDLRPRSRANGFFDHLLSRIQILG